MWAVESPELRSCSVLPPNAPPNGQPGRERLSWGHQYPFLSLHTKDGHQLHFLLAKHSLGAQGDLNTVPMITPGALPLPSYYLGRHGIVVQLCKGPAPFPVLLSLFPAITLSAPETT